MNDIGRSNELKILFVFFFFFFFSIVSTGDNVMNANFSELGCQMPKDIEDEAISFFLRFYNHPPHPTLSIDEILDFLIKFQSSSATRERVCRIWYM